MAFWVDFNEERSRKDCRGPGERTVSTADMREEPGSAGDGKRKDSKWIRMCMKGCDKNQTRPGISLFLCLLFLMLLSEFNLILK